jgi:Methyltransferase domain
VFSEDARKVNVRIGTVINFLLRPAGVELVRRRASSGRNPHVLGYVSATATVKAAQVRGLSVCDYLEWLWNEPGTTLAVVESMREIGVFDVPIVTVCEIGTGSGKFLEKTIAHCRPNRYESYEPDREWSDWLEREYDIISQPTDGYSLRHTSAGSVDLVHAHGVFVYLPFLTTYRYFREIARVAARGAYVVFNIISEDCMDEATVSEWLCSDHNFPVMLPRQYVINIFKSWGFLLRGEFSSRLGAGRSHYLVFQHDEPA